MSAGPVMIMAGGTGGHVFPGLAVAAALRERQRDVVWLGTRRGLEARVVPQQGIDIEWVSIAGLRGKGFAAALAAPFRVALAIVQALGAIRRRRPSAVLGMGGFVSGPGGVAAWLARKPLLIHEQNAVAGTTNRWLARFATRVFEAFPGSFPAGVDAECIGNPVRRSIAALTPASRRITADLLRSAGGSRTSRTEVARGVDVVDAAGDSVTVAGGVPRAVPRARRPRLLVLGGSQGARVLNETVPAALARLAPEARPEVLHQAGREHERAVERYRDAGVDARVEAFIDDMAAAYAWADFAVARSGALTVSELAAAGLGAVLVPYPHAIDDHQRRNAEQFAALDAGVVVDERDLTVDSLAAALEPLLRDPARLASMSEGAASFARRDAAERLADACLALAEAAA